MKIINLKFRANLPRTLLSSKILEKDYLSYLEKVQEINNCGKSELEKIAGSVFPGHVYTVTSEPVFTEFEADEKKFYELTGIEFTLQIPNDPKEKINPYLFNFVNSMKNYEVNLEFNLDALQEYGLLEEHILME